MHPDRPRLKIPLETLDYILEFITLTVLIILWCYAIMKYMSMPDIIPTHFNLSGEVDGTGSKTSIWFLLGITTVLAVGIHILTKYPHIHNYMVEITEKNAAHNYKMSARLLRFVNLITLLVMSYIAFTVIKSALGETAATGNTLIYVMIAFGVIMPIILVIYVAKNQKVATSKK
ncbi:DUF1648 domain-containing protein [Kordia algicida OT-1]|uniref:DUF1648 domain-containing protein n=1 Tax=Kordia algicida OT-1 TaxID=391587 RepID=A9EAX4_9FLAO|nr:DUF1648 domain-containing protein [Kordia algicida]EDP94546.1 hypothetical protein KAOT1_10301 [Kordia algicida OT-1]